MSRPQQLLIKNFHTIIIRKHFTSASFLPMIRQRKLHGNILAKLKVSRIVTVIIVLYVNRSLAMQKVMYISYKVGM